MFMLRNGKSSSAAQTKANETYLASKYLFGSPQTKQSVIEIPQGRLYLVRPLSPKGYSELIFRDATCSIRRTALQHHFQLAIQRVYEEGEEGLDAEDPEGDDPVSGLSSEKDEKTFLLDGELEFRSSTNSDGEAVFAWRDLSGDDGDLFEFVCDQSVHSNVIASFEEAALRCQYERKYRKDSDQASAEDLREFVILDNDIPDTGTTSLTTSQTLASARPSANTEQNMAPKTNASRDQDHVNRSLVSHAPVAVKAPQAKEILVEERAELHLFDFESGTFVLQDSDVKAKVSEIGNWDYWLQISGEEKDWLGQAIVPDLNPVFNFEYLSFIFNHYTDDGSAYSWLLRFRDQKVEERFQQGLMQALWEHLNQVKWLKAKDDEREYVLEAFQDLTMEDVHNKDEDEDKEEDEDDEIEAEPASSFDSDAGGDDDESDHESVKHDDEKIFNSQLAVGFKNDRSFVVRGSKIGVFKNTPNNLEFSTNISKVQTPKGKMFSPKKVMLHAEDRDMILQDPTESNSLYRMDLEYGKVVDEWKIHDDIPVKTFAPEKKYAQMTSEPTLIGLSDNALYRIDPRLSGLKLVDSQLKQYASKNNFSAAATTANGYIAVASDKGDVRMFDRLGIIAKTHIPALGDPITGLDVSADGRWVLATTRTYLLLIDALQKDGKNAGKLGFEKGFGKDSKPQPRRLALSPSHVAQFMHETKSGISFTPARFNTGVDSSETTIVTATGPFVITWSMKKVLQARKDPYSIKRYAEQVKADDFRYGTDRNLIVALPNEVAMVRKGELKRPTRESIAGPGITAGSSRASGTGFGLATPRRSARGSRLSKDEIVNSPY